MLSRRTIRVWNKAVNSDILPAENSTSIVYLQCYVWPYIKYCLVKNYVQMDKVAFTIDSIPYVSVGYTIYAFTKSQVWMRTTNHQLLETFGFLAYTRWLTSL